MRVLTIYASPDPRSFCHAVLEAFTRGLTDAGHESEVVDLYAINFDPVFSMQDAVCFAHDTVPREVLESMKLKESVLALSRGPIQRFMATRWLRDKDVYDIAKAIRQHQPKDVLDQQEKVARADGLAFISPIFWMGFPAILKGWIERVFTYGFVYYMTPEGWAGDLAGRVPLMKHNKALIINTTFFQERDYKQGFHDAITKIIDEFGFRYPGIQQVEHVYLYKTLSVDDQTRQEYLERAYRLGAEFDVGFGGELVDPHQGVSPARVDSRVRMSR